MSNYDNTNTGALFKNERKPAGSKQPDYRGKVNVDGRDLELAGWVREVRSGKFISLKISEPYVKPERDERPSRFDEPADDFEF